MKRFRSAIHNKAHELAQRAEVVYGQDEKQAEKPAGKPDMPGVTAVIYERDDSNREGIYRQKSSAWGRGYFYYEGPPTYERQYILPAEFPLVGSRECGIRKFNILMAQVDRPELLPVVSFAMELNRDFQGLVEGAGMLNPRTIDVQLSWQADQEWETRYGSQFHEALGRCVMARYSMVDNVDFQKID
jgi:hypothetical protein